MKKFAGMSCLAAALLLGSVAQAQTVKVAWLDQLSGPMAGLGNNVLKSFQHIATVANQENWAGPVRFEIVPFDNKLSPQEALSLFNKITAEGIRYVVQGTSSSSVGLALIDAVDKYNARHPGGEVLYLNYAAQAPAMTNAKCSYWHFRTDADSDMKVQAIVAALAADASIRKVFLLNPNYAYGQEVARAVRDALKARGANIAVVGEDFHPTGQVKDYAPYIAKIKAANADAVVTADFGNDLALMVRAARDAGFAARFYTLNANNFGVPSAMGAAGEGRVKLISSFYPSDAAYGAPRIVEGFRARYGEDFISGQGYTALRMLATAIRDSGSVEPGKVAARMESLKVDSLNGPVQMRADDHQLQPPLYVLSWERRDGKTVRYDQEGTGFGWKPDRRIDAASVSLPTVCKMKRP